MAVDFPSSPTPGQAYTQGGVTWTWDGVKWVAQGTGTGIYLPLAGGIMTGDITLKGDPSAPLHPVTYRMVSNPNDNRIINGDMRIDQRWNGASGTGTNAYALDRWLYATSVGAKGTTGRNLNSAASLAATGFPYYLGFQSSSAYTPLAGDYFNFAQPIEADMVSDFAWGTASAQAVILSFWANSSLTGTFSGSIIDYAGTRAYPFSYSLPTANTWTKIVITIPGDTAGAWVMSGNGGAAYVQFDLGSGATYRKPAGAWVAGAFISGANGAVNVVATNAAKFYVTGVKLEVGSVATPFNRQSLAKSMADCQRYYQTYTGLFTYTSYTPAGQVFYNTFTIPTMRTTPTVTSDTPSGAGNASGFNTTPGGSNSISTYATSSSAAQAYFYLNVHCSAEL